MLASAGIIWWAARWVGALRRWLPAVAAEAVAVPLAAQLATTPVVAQLSGTVSVVGLLANALAGPFVGPATVLGFAAAGASLISARLAAVIGFAAAWSAQPIVWVGRTAARLPGASTTWPTSVASIALLVAAVVVIGWSMGPALARRWVCLLAAGVMVAALLRPPSQPGWPPPGWVMVACDVGQGDGAVLNLGAGRAVVVDAGPDPPAMRTCLDRLGIGEVSLLVLTHFHADHIDGLSGVLDHRRIARIWVSPLASPTAGAAAVRTAAAARGIPIEVPAVGSAGRLGSASWSVLGPLGSAATDPGGDGAESEGENNASLVIMVQLAGIRILLTGDVEPPGQAAMVDARDDLRADVLKVPHHGSGRQEPRFLAAVHARFAVVSAGRHNDYGHPAPRTVAALTALGATVLRTDTAGSVAVVARLDHSLVAVAQRDPALAAGRPLSPVDHDCVISVRGGSVDRHPGRTGSGARGDGTQHPLDGQTVGERGPRLRVVGDVPDEVDHLMGEPVLVAEAVTGRPPGADVRVVRLGDQDPAESLLGGRPGAVEELEHVVVLEVERQGAGRAAELDPERVLAPEREPGRLERADRAAVEAGQERRGVVDGDLATRRVGGGLAVAAETGSFAAQRARPDEGLQQRGDAGDRLAGEPLGGVDDVRADVAQCAGAGVLGLQPPGHRRVLVGQPVLQVLGADLADRAEAAGVDQLLGQASGRAYVGRCSRTWPARRGRRPRSAAAAICSASATVLASGFSHSTCLPASSAAIAISACRSPGVQMSTRSTSSRSITRRQSVSTEAKPNRSAAAETASGLRPEITVSSGVSGRSKNRWALRQAWACTAPMNA